MDAGRAFLVMTNSLTAADASRRQVEGVLAWRDMVLAARHAAREAGGDGAMNVPAACSGTHRAWREQCQAIIAALAGGAARADIMHREALAAAAAAEASAAAAAARAQAAAARASVAEAAASAPGDGEDGAAAAQGAAAEAAAAMAEAAEAQAEESAALAAAEAAREQARRALAWMQRAGDAAAFGRSLVRREDAVHLPVAEAIQAAGGITETAASKRYYTGGSLALAGGAR